MAVIIEVVAPSGKVLERHKIEQPEIAIGRAYDNDIILSDNTIDSHHASITVTEEGIIVCDLNSTNGLHYKHQNVNKDISINSGDELILGKTHLRIFESDHSVPEAITIVGRDWLVHFLSKGWVTIASLLLLTLFVILELWSTSIVEFKLRGYIEAVFIIDSIVIIYALIWGIVGKFVKHAMYFKTQLSLISIYLIISYGTDFIYVCFFLIR